MEDVIFVCYKNIYSILTPKATVINVYVHKFININSITNGMSL